MPTLLRLERAAQGIAFADTEDPFEALEPGREPRPGLPVIVPLDRFRSEGDAWHADERLVGVRLAADEPVEALADSAPRLALVALEFPTFRDGRAYSSAAVLRERLGFAGELRAVGEVLREQAFLMVRAGFDAFVPSDGSDAAAWTRAAARYAHVYQAAADGRRPAFAERTRGSAVPAG